MIGVERGADGALVVEQRRSLVVRLFIGASFGLMALMFILFLFIPFVGPRSIGLKCDRAAGGCTIDRGTAKQTVPLSALRKAEVRRDNRGGRSWRVSTRSLYLVASPRDAWLCTAPAQTPQAARIEEVARVVEAWRVDPSAPPVSADCIEDTETIGELIFWPFAGSGLVAFCWLVARVLATTRVTVRAGEVRVEQRWLLAFRSRRIVERSAITAIDAGGGRIMLRLGDKPPLYLFGARVGSPDARAIDAAAPQIQAVLGLPSSS